MVVLVFFSDKNVNGFIFHQGTSCPLMFQLHHIPVSSLHHAYCAVLSSFTMSIIFVLSSSPQVLFPFQVFHHGSLALLSSLFSSLYWYPLFIALQHIIIVIRATSGIFRLDLFGMILIHLAWMAQRLGGSTALASFSSFIISGGV